MIVTWLRQNGWRAVACAMMIVAIVAAVPRAAADPTEMDDLATRDPDYAAGKAAIEKKNWKEAVKRFNQVVLREPQNADVHNFLGYAYRNLNQFELAFKHYKQSIAINPYHRGAHEYIGEAYLMTNDPASAEKHLTALREICLLPCEELADLEKAVKAYRAKKPR
jgi:Flp pilus assembly protein TadD